MPLASRTIAVAVCSATVAIALAGCASAAPAGSPSPSAPAETSAAATPTPTPTPTSAYDPADPSTWAITETAIGPFELGAPLQDSAASVSALFVDDFQCGQARFYDGVAGASGLALVLGSTAMDEAAAIEEIALSTTEGVGGADTPTPRTTEGVGLGSPEADVTAAYPSGTMLDSDPANADARIIYEVPTSVGTLSFAMDPADRVVEGVRVTAEGYDPGSCM